MEKSVLIEYCDMQVEIKELKKLIKATEEKIAKMEEKERTRDVVSGGAGGTQHFNPGSYRRQAGPLPWQSGTSYPGKTKRREGCPGRRAELYLSCGEWNQAL